MCGIGNSNLDNNGVQRNLYPFCNTVHTYIVLKRYVHFGFNKSYNTLKLLVELGACREKSGSAEEAI